jgi:hypothetical protein
MKLSCKLEFSYGSEKEAKAVLKAVEVDNDEFVKTTLEGAKLLSIVESDSIPSLIHTLDDYLACVSVAERVVKGE